MGTGSGLSNGCMIAKPDELDTTNGATLHTSDNCNDGLDAGDTGDIPGLQKCAAELAACPTGQRRQLSNGMANPFAPCRNAAPAFSSDTATRTIAENSAAGTNVGVAVTATDSDGDTLTYSLSGTDAGSFEIGANNGQIAVKSGTSLDFESKESYSVTVEVKDGKDDDGAADTGEDADDTIDVTINVTDASEPPGKPDAPMVSPTPSSNTSLDVTWTAPVNTGRPAITSYDLRYREARLGGGFTSGPQGVTSTRSAITGLHPGTSYQVQVRATNDDGDGAWSDSGSGTTAGARPPGVTLSATSVTVSEAGGEASYKVVLDTEPEGTVTVTVASDPGTAATVRPRRLVFTPTDWDEPQSVTVIGVDDRVDNPGDARRATVSHTAAGGRYTEVVVADVQVTVTDDDGDDDAARAAGWLARVGRTLGGQTVDAVTARLEGGGRSGGTLGGVPIELGEPPADALGARVAPWRHGPPGDAWEARTMTAEEFLPGTVFHLSTGEEETGGPGFAAWGRFAKDRFEGEDGGVSMDGTVATGFLGADVEWRRALAGLLFSRGRSEGTYRAAEGDRVRIESTLTGLYPYARLSLSERVSAWGLGGSSHGDLTLKADGRTPLETEVAVRMGAVGVAGRVLDGAHGLGLNFRSDAMWVGMKSDPADGMAATDSDVTRWRLIVEGERSFDLGDGATLTPSTELGLRVDGGDAETGTGIELGGRLRYAAGRLVVEGGARTLVAHEGGGYEELGASAALRLNPNASGRGLSLSLVPVWGTAWNDAARLWSAGDASAFTRADGLEPRARLEAELGYGFGLADGPGVVTPYAGFWGAGAGSRTWRTGVRWKILPDASLGLEAVRRESAGDNAPEHAIGVRLKARH